MTTPRYEITVETSMAASHQLRGYKGEIEPLHGHNFRVEATVDAARLDALGLVMDFVELEAILKEILSPYDHRHLNDLPPFDAINPSTEEIARIVYEALEARLRPRGARPKRVRVWEAPSFSASYGPDL